MKKWKKSRCEICEKYFSCDSHHIIPRSEKGNNQSHNLSVLCPNCHREVTSNEIQIIRRYLTSDGFMLETVRNNQRFIGKKEFSKPEIIEQLTLF